ncbi:hypothetical protein [Tuberibacillus sp. Marseille-P3662]|uniref:hypothetical protein n=1 Tax=Tuberibacillus sp. Marseille-P3662 TaxID=1965358 RepID=UPI000A1C9E99|nr:hypothetical protein [Tuberibacillus sp. Marseille-P3662]
MQQQPQSQPQGQTFMQQPPFVMSTKDHLYMKDMMTWNLNAIKKTNFFAQQCQDPEIKNALMQLSQMHQNHYQTLLNSINQHLGQTNQPQQGGMQ